MTSTVLEGGFRRALSDGALVVANPAAAGVTAGLVADVADRLRAGCRHLQVSWTTGPGHARELVTHAGRRGVVVAVGGDGTVREAAEAVAASGDGQVLLALPAGSGNSSARNIWGDAGVADVLDLVLDPAATTVRRLDMLRLEEPGVTVLLGASSGFLAQVLIDARGVDPSVKGIDRYYAAAGGVLAAMPDHPTRVTVDGRVIHDGPASSVAVGGGRFRASAFQFLPDSVLDDGLLDVSTIGALDAAAVAELAPLVPTGQHISRPDVSYARGRRVVIERTDGERLVAEYDGDVWAAAGPRLTAEVVPAALPVVAPAQSPCG
jgi:diacylglycerol kinase (ATP)